MKVGLKRAVWGVGLPLHSYSKQGCTDVCVYIWKLELTQRLTLSAHCTFCIHFLGSNMFLSKFFALAAWAGLTIAAPFPHADIISSSVNVNNIISRDSTVDSCPGYTASNVVTTDSTLTADLALAGTACNVYSDDIQDLKLVVEYQTSTSTTCSYLQQTERNVISSATMTNTMKMIGSMSRSTTRLSRSSKSRRRSYRAQRTTMQPHQTQRSSLTLFSRLFPSR